VTKDVESKAPKDEPAAKADAALSREERLVQEARRWFPLVIAGGTLAVGYLMGPALGILVLAAGAAVWAIATLWGSVRALVGETPLTGEDAFAMGAPSVEEEQKRAVIRAIKDLEFERSVGKISEEDYAVLVAKYRAEAKRLLRVLDERASPQRAKAEKLVASHLATKGIAKAHEPVEHMEENPFAPPARVSEPNADAPPTTTKKSRKKKRRGERAATATGEDSGRRVRCAECGASNEPDARFCKGCARTLDVKSEEVAQ
jgi:hypothetical protein